MDEEKIKKLRTMHNADRKFILDEAKGIINNKAQIDEIISDGLENWDIERLSKIDLSILRIAVYEIVFADDIPNAVAANEAVQLAQKFSGDKATKFINGILGNVIKRWKMQVNVYTVSQINGYIKRVFENDVFLSDLYIEGEISNFKLHTSGHLYFSLKDKTGSVDCVMFRSDAARLDFMPENGIGVLVRGRVSL